MVKGGIMNKIIITLFSLACALTAIAKDEDANIYYKGDRIRLKAETDAFGIVTSGQVGSVPERFDSVKYSVLPLNMDNKNPSSRQPLIRGCRELGCVRHRTDRNSGPLRSRLLFLFCYDRRSLGSDFHPSTRAWRLGGPDTT